MWVCESARRKWLHKKGKTLCKCLCMLVCVWWGMPVKMPQESSRVSRGRDRGNAWGSRDWEELLRWLGLWASAPRDRCLWVCRRTAHKQLFHCRTTSTLQNISIRLEKIVTLEKDCFFNCLSSCWLWLVLLFFHARQLQLNHQSVQLQIKSY